MLIVVSDIPTKYKTTTTMHLRAQVTDCIEEMKGGIHRCQLTPNIAVSLGQTPSSRVRIPTAASRRLALSPVRKE